MWLSMPVCLHSSPFWHNVDWKIPIFPVPPGGTGGRNTGVCKLYCRQRVPDTQCRMQKHTRSQNRCFSQTSEELHHQGVQSSYNRTVWWCSHRFTSFNTTYCIATEWLGSFESMPNNHCATKVLFLEKYQESGILESWFLKYETNPFLFCHANFCLSTTPQAVQHKSCGK